MKNQLLSLILLSFAISAAGQAPPVYQAPTPAPTAASAAATPPAATPAPPPAAPPKRSAADLEKLVAPIALYPDPLIATVLMASVYPLEVVQAARFVADTNNLANLDAQPWDDNVKSVARVPDAIKKMNEDISWTIEMGEAFLAQDKDVMDAIQSMRSKAQKAGTLQTNPQQTVVVTNMVVEKTVEQQVVVVTNTVVQIQPSNPQVVYVPSYNPATVYYPPPAYVYDPIAPLVTFTAGVAMGAIIANNCNWYGGGCYHGGDVDIDIDSNRNVNRNTDRASARSTGSGQKWQPDQNRLSKSGAPGVSNSARSMEARGWGGSDGARPSTGNNAAARPSSGAAGARPSTGNAGTRPNAGNAGTRPSTGTPSGNRPTASPAANRPSPSPSTSQSRAGSSGGRSDSAFSGVNSGASARDSSSRGSSSRGGGGGFGGGGGGRGGGGGGRGGGGRR